MCPADTQQETNKCAKEWGEEWGSEKANIEVLKCPEDIGRPAARVTG